MAKVIAVETKVNENADTTARALYSGIRDDFKKLEDESSVKGAFDSDSTSSGYIYSCTWEFTWYGDIHAALRGEHGKNPGSSITV